jgi:hypothetical protein
MGRVISLEERRELARKPSEKKQHGYGPLIRYPAAYLQDARISGTELRLLCAYFAARAWGPETVSRERATEIHTALKLCKQYVRKIRLRLVDLGYLKIAGDCVQLIRLEGDPVNQQFTETAPPVNQQFTKSKPAVYQSKPVVYREPDQSGQQCGVAVPLQALQDTDQTHTPETLLESKKDTSTDDRPVGVGEVRVDRTADPFDGKEWRHLQEIGGEIGLSLFGHDATWIQSYPLQWRSLWRDFSPEDREWAVRQYTDQPEDERKWWKISKTLIERLVRLSGEHKVAAVSTKPPAGIFQRCAANAAAMISRRVAPKWCRCCNSVV